LENKESPVFNKFIGEIHKIKIFYSLYDARFALFIFDVLQDVKGIDPIKISFVDADTFFEEKENEANDEDIFNLM
jgi:hypothetical protein